MTNCYHHRCRLELIREAPVNEARYIRSANATLDFLKQHTPITTSAVEHCYALALNTRHRLVAHYTVSQGDIAASIVSPRLVYVPALLANASAVIVAHNHPSGDLSPSADDFAVQERLRRAGDTLGVKLLDFVIVNEDTIHSLGGSS
jgi:DNA repair protein RadC